MGVRSTFLIERDLATDLIRNVLESDNLEDYVIACWLESLDEYKNFHVVDDLTDYNDSEEYDNRITDGCQLQYYDDIVG